MRKLPAETSTSRRFPAGKVLLAASVFAVLLAACSEEPQRVTKPSQSAAEGPDQEFIDTRFVVTENGLTSAIVRADSVLVFQTRKVSELSGHVDVDFYTREGKHVSTLTANEGIIYGETESIDSLRAEGDVTITWFERNATMKTPFIRWLAKSRTIYADSTVVLAVEDAVEQGVRFEAPDDLGSYTMQSVSGVVESDKIKIPSVPGGNDRP